MLAKAWRGYRKVLGSAHAFAIVAIVSAIAGLVFPPLILVGFIFAVVGGALAATEWKRMRAPVVALIVSLLAMCIVCGGFSLSVLGSAINKKFIDARREGTVARLQSVHAALEQYAQTNKGWYPSDEDGLAKLVTMGMVKPEQVLSLDIDGTNVRPYFYVEPARQVSEYVRVDQIIVAYEDPRIMNRPAVLYMDGRVEFKRYLELRNALLAQKSSPPPHEPGMR
jgi:hypothetical protein